MDSQAMHQRLMAGAQTGDINSLYSLLGEDAFVLENFDRIPFTVTPLHKAVESGQTKFALEIVRLKHLFLRKLNQDGFSPIHIASANGDVIMVRKLMDIDPDLYFFKGREGRTPLHFASFAGKADVIDELLSSCPEAIEELTIGDETALHLAVRNNQLEAFQALVGWLKWLGKMHLLRSKDDEGNTVLHIAASTNQSEVVKMLVNNRNTAKWVEINARNASGFTALDILQQLPREVDTCVIGEMLVNAKAVKAQDLPSLSQHTITFHHSTNPYPNRKERTLLGKCMRYIEYWMIPREIAIDVRNVLLVVATLIATATFQVGLSPPKSVWRQDKHQCGNNNGTVSTEVAPDKAGHVFHDVGSVLVFTVMNSLGFYTSLVMIAILTLGLPLYGLIVTLLFSLMFTYIWSTPVIKPNAGIIFLLYALLSIKFLVVTLALRKYNKKKKH